MISKHSSVKKKGESDSLVKPAVELATNVSMSAY